MKKERILNLFEGLLLCIQEQNEPEEEEAPVEGEEPEEEVEETEGTDEVGVDEEPVEDSEEQLSVVDQVYRLKKVYVKLLAISRILDYLSDIKYDDLRDKVLEAIDLFHIIVSNYENFRDKIDNIIKSYYRFLHSSVKELDRLSKRQE